MSKKLTARLVPLVLVIALAITFGLVLAFAPSAESATATEFVPYHLVSSLEYEEKVTVADLKANLFALTDGYATKDEAYGGEILTIEVLNDTYDPYRDTAMLLVGGTYRLKIRYSADSNGHPAGTLWQNLEITLPEAEPAPLSVYNSDLRVGGEYYLPNHVIEKAHKSSPLTVSASMLTLSDATFDGSVVWYAASDLDEPLSAAPEAAGSYVAMFTLASGNYYEEHVYVYYDIVDAFYLSSDYALEYNGSCLTAADLVNGINGGSVLQRGASYSGNPTCDQITYADTGTNLYRFELSEMGYIYPEGEGALIRPGTYDLSVSWVSGSGYVAGHSVEMTLVVSPKAVLPLTDSTYYGDAAPDVSSYAVPKVVFTDNVTCTGEWVNADGTPSALDMSAPDAGTYYIKWTLAGDEKVYYTLESGYETYTLIEPFEVHKRQVEIALTYKNAALPVGVATPVLYDSEMTFVPSVKGAAADYLSVSINAWGEQGAPDAVGNYSISDGDYILTSDSVNVDNFVVANSNYIVTVEARKIEVAASSKVGWTGGEVIPDYALTFALGFGETAQSDVELAKNDALISLGEETVKGTDIGTKVDETDYKVVLNVAGDGSQYGFWTSGALQTSYEWTYEIVPGEVPVTVTPIAPWYYKDPETDFAEKFEIEINPAAGETGTELLSVAFSEKAEPTGTWIEPNTAEDMHDFATLRNYVAALSVGDTFYLRIVLSGSASGHYATTTKYIPVTIRKAPVYLRTSDAFLYSNAEQSPSDVSFTYYIYKAAGGYEWQSVRADEFATLWHVNATEAVESGVRYYERVADNVYLPYYPTEPTIEGGSVYYKATGWTDLVVGAEVDTAAHEAHVGVGTYGLYATIATAFEDHYEIVPYDRYNTETESMEIVDAEASFRILKKDLASTYTIETQAYGSRDLARPVIAPTTWAANDEDHDALTERWYYSEYDLEADSNQWIPIEGVLEEDTESSNYGQYVNAFPTYPSVGTYYVKYVATYANYVDVVKTASFVVTPRELTLSWQIGEVTVSGEAWLQEVSYLYAETGETYFYPQHFTYNGAEQLPALTFTNLLAGDEVSVTGVTKQAWDEAQFSLEEEASCKAAGGHRYTVTAIDNDNYLLPQGAKAGAAALCFVIDKAPLTVTAEDKAITYGQAKPDLTVSYVGFVGGEEADVLGGTKSISCDYDVTNAMQRAAIEYPITLADYASDNYQITLVNGTLSVAKRAITVAIKDASSDYGAASPAALTWEPFTGDNLLAAWDEAADVFDLALCETYLSDNVLQGGPLSYTATTSAGKYYVVGGSENANYVVTFTGSIPADAEENPWGAGVGIYTINKVAATKVDPAPIADLTYSAEGQYLVAEGVSEYGSYTYQLVGVDETPLAARTQAKDQGTYTVNWWFAGDGNHLDDSGSVEVTIDAYAVPSSEILWTLCGTGTDGAYIYSGTVQAFPTAKLTGLGTDGAITLVVSEQNGKTFKNAGDYRFTASSDNGNYFVSDALCDVSMGQKDLTLTWSHTDDLIYNGQSQKPTLAGVTGVVGEDEFAAGDEANKLYYDFGGATYCGSWTGGWALNCQLIGARKDNYYIKVGASVDFRIAPKSLSFTWTGEADETPFSFLYDGEGKVLGVSTTSMVNNARYGGTLDEIELIVTYYDALYPSTALPAPPTDKGNYIARVTIADTAENVALSRSIAECYTLVGAENTEQSFTIGAKSIEVSWPATLPTWVYDGEVQTDIQIAEAWDGEEQVSVTVSVQGEAPFKAAGDYVLAATSNDPNYTLLNDTLNVTIRRRALAVTWSLDGVANKSVVTYNGEDHAVTALFTDTVGDGDGLDANEWIETTETDVRNCKEGTFVYTIPAGDYGDNYTIESDLVFDWTMVGQEVTVVYTSGVKQVVYGNAAAWAALGEEMAANHYYLALQEPAVLGSGDAITDVVTLWMENEQGVTVDPDEESPVGTYYLRAASKGNPNYSILSIALGANAKLYVIEAEILAEGVEQDLGEKGDRELIYNGMPQRAEVDTSGIATVNGQAWSIVYQSLDDPNAALDPNAWAGDVPAFETVGVYKVYYLITAENHAPYGGQKEVYFLVEVKGARLVDVSIECESLTYNGEAQRASVVTYATAIDPEQVGEETPEPNEISFAYRPEGEEDWSEEVPLFTEAGVYTVYYKASAPNHVDATGSFEVRINAAALTGVSAAQLIEDEASALVYNGEAQRAVVATAATSVDGRAVTFEYRLDGEEDWSEEVPAFTDAGEHTVCYRASCASHEDAFGSFLVTIEKAELYDLDVRQDLGAFDAETLRYEYALTYNGKAQIARVQTIGHAVNDLPITYTYSTAADGPYDETIPAFTAAGNHTVYFKATAANHYEVSGEFDVLINEKSLEVEFTVANTVYGTPVTAPTFENRGIVIKGWVEGEETTLTASDEAGLAEYLSVYYFPKGDYATFGEFDEAVFGGMNEQESASYAEAHQALPTQAGDYFVLLVVGGVDNYGAIYEVVEMTIAKKALTVTYEGGYTPYGYEADDYVYGVVYDGFVYDETEEVLEGVLAFDSAYNVACNAGEYGVTPKGLTSDNYDITFVGGILLVDKASINVDAAVESVTYGTAIKVPTIGDGMTVEGLVNGDTAELLLEEGVMTIGFAPAKYDGVFLADIEDLDVMDGVPTQAGEYIFFVTIDGLDNYGRVSMESAFTISPKAVTVTADDLWSYRGDALAALTWTGDVEEGDTVCTASTDANKDVAGEYTITLTSTANPNYVVTLRNGKYLVKEKEAEPETEEQGDKTETSKEISPEEAKDPAGVSITDAIKTIYAAAAASDVPVVTLELKIGTVATVAFDKAAIAKLAEAEDVKITYVEYKGSEIAPSVPAYEKAELVIEVSLKGGTFEGGTATITTAFENLASGGKKAVLYYVDATGKKVDMHATFEDGTVTFETGHFSTYVVEYVLAGGAIAGIVVGSTVGAAGLAVGAYFLLRKRGGKKDSDDTAEESPAEPKD